MVIYSYYRIGNIGGEHLKNALAVFRQRAGFKTQEELSVKLGIRKSTVSRWENGERCPHPFMIKELSHTLGVTTDEIITAISAAKQQSAS